MSSVTAMTLDLGTDMGQVETRQSVLPTEALHDLDVLTLKSTCEIWTFFAKLEFLHQVAFVLTTTPPQG